MPTLLSGPAGGGKTIEARRLVNTAAVPSVMIDFQDLYATVLGIEREEENGRYPERLPTQSYALPMAEAMRLRAIDVALEMELDVVLTNSSSDQTRRSFLLTRLGAGATETIIDPGIEVVTERLSVGGILSQQCSQAISRWFG